MKILRGDCNYSMILLKKILNHSFWLLIGNSVGRLTMFLANIFAARLLSQDLFGQYMMVRSTVSMMEGSIMGSIGNIIIKIIAGDSHKEKNDVSSLVLAIILINVILSLIIILSLFFTSSFIVDRFFLGDNNIISGLYMGGFLFATTLFASSAQVILIGLEKYKEIAIAGVLNIIISIPIIYYLLTAFGFIGILIGISLYFLSDFIIKSIFINKQLNLLTFIPNITIMIDIIKNVYIKSGSLFLSVFISSFAFWYIRVVTINKSNSFVDIAVFDAAYQWLTIIMLITGATTSIALQMLSKNRNENSFDKRRIFVTNLYVNIVIATFFATIFSFFSKNIMSMYGDAYTENYYLIYILGVIAILYTISSVLNKLLIVSNEQKFILLTNIVSSISVVIFIQNINYLNFALELATSFVLFYLISIVMYIFKIRINNINV